MDETWLYVPRSQRAEPVISSVSSLVLFEYCIFRHQARELKSVYVDAKGRYLKFVMHCCHVNQANLFNQIGIVALNAICVSSSVELLINLRRRSLESMSRIQSIQLMSATQRNRVARYHAANASMILRLI